MFCVFGWRFSHRSVCSVCLVGESLTTHAVLVRLRDVRVDGSSVVLWRTRIDKKPTVSGIFHSFFPLAYLAFTVLNYRYVNGDNENSEVVFRVWRLSPIYLIYPCMQCNGLPRIVGGIVLFLFFAPQKTSSLLDDVLARALSLSRSLIRAKFPPIVRTII